MSLGEWLAYAAGWRKAHGGPDKPRPPSDEQFYDMVARLGGGRVHGYGS